MCSSSLPLGRALSVNKDTRGAVTGYPCGNAKHTLRVVLWGGRCWKDNQVARLSCAGFPTTARKSQQSGSSEKGMANSFWGAGGCFSEGKVQTELQGRISEMGARPW